MDLMWTGDSVTQYDKLREDADVCGISLPDFVKEVLRRRMDGDAEPE